MSPDVSVSSTSDSADATILPYELRIGVTGHRKLSDAAAVAEAVEGVVDHIGQTIESAAEFPEGPAGSPRSFGQKCERRLARMIGWVWRSLPLSGTHTPPGGRTPLHWTVISPLAKGADRIVARAVLNRPGARLEVITPFPVDEYRRDFAEPEDRAEFDELFALDPHPVELDPDLGPTDAPDRQARRNEGYFEVGQRVVDASEIVIIVWNGKPAEGRGGTGDVVQYALERGRVVLWIDAENPAAPARQIVGFELQATGSGAFPQPITQPLPTVARHISPRFHRLAAYNRDAAHDGEEVRAILDRNAAELQETARKAGLPESLLQPVLEHLLPHYFYQGPEGWFIEPFRPLLEKIRQAIRIEPQHHEALKRFLIDGWIGNQAAWHTRNAVRKHRSARRFHVAGIVLFVITLVMATLHLFGVGHEHPQGPPTSAAWHLVGLGITFLAITLPAWAAAVHAVGTLLDRERIAARSERMAEILQTLAQRAEQARTLQALQAEAAHAEEVMAAENQEWLVSLSFHELVLPV